MNRILGLLVLAALFMCGLVAIPPTAHAVQGDVEWSYSLAAGYYGGGTGVLTHGDGTVTVAGGCSTSTTDHYRLDTLSPSKDVNNQDSGASYPTMCSGSGVAGVDGMVFYTKTVSGHRAVVPMKNGHALPAVDFNFQCSSMTGGGWGQPKGMIVGADGNVYVTIPGANTGTGNCSAMSRLVKIDGVTGEKVFTVNLASRSAGSQGAPTKMGVYAGGLVLLEEDVDSSGRDLLTYMGYDGVKNDTLSCALHSTTDSCGFTIVNGENVNFFHVNENGTAYIDTSRYVGGTCPTTRRTLKYDVLGTAVLVTRPSDCPAMHLNLLGPNNTLVYTEVNGNVITVMDTAGNTLYQGNKVSKPGYTVTQVSPMVMDGTGSVVVGRVARQGASLDKHLYVDRLNTDGTWSNLFSTEQYANPSVTDDFKYRVNYDLPFVAFAEDYLYVAYCETGCSASGGMKLAKVSSPGMGIEYPRSEVFAEYFTTNGEELDYVALGDSYSSGEGVPVFIAGTDVTGPPENRCHRSTSAYSMMLDSTSSLNLNLRSFRACSGATTQDVNVGMWGENGQLDSITSETDVATLTVGGNDVGFGDYAEACVITSCDTGSVPYQNIVYSINNALDPNLVSLYKDILDRSSQLELYVIGYPYLTLDNIPSGYTCVGGGMSAESAAGAHSVVTQLNQKIQDAVDIAIVDGYGSRIHYVNPNYTGGPFENHTLCNTESYFNGVVTPAEYSFHPNQSGQAAYSVIVKDAMTP